MAGVFERVHQTRFFTAVSAVKSVAAISINAFELTVNNPFQNPTKNLQQIRDYENETENVREL